MDVNDYERRTTELQEDLHEAKTTILLQKKQIKNYEKLISKQNDKIQWLRQFIVKHHGKQVLHNWEDTYQNNSNNNNNKNNNNDTTTPYTNNDIQHELASSSSPTVAAKRRNHHLSSHKRNKSTKIQHGVREERVRLGSNWETITSSLLSPSIDHLPSDRSPSSHRSSPLQEQEQEPQQLEEEEQHDHVYEAVLFSSQCTVDSQSTDATTDSSPSSSHHHPHHPRHHTTTIPLGKQDHSVTISSSPSIRQSRADICPVTTTTSSSSYDFIEQQQQDKERRHLPFHAASKKPLWTTVTSPFNDFGIENKQQQQPKATVATRKRSFDMNLDLFISPPAVNSRFQPRRKEETILFGHYHDQLFESDQRPPLNTIDQNHHNAKVVESSSSSLKHKKKEDHFLKRPDPNSEFPYAEVVRKKDERAKLHGTACTCCVKFYESAGHLATERIQQVSRHREKYHPAKTPPGFWDLDFPPSP